MTDRSDRLPLLSSDPQFAEGRAFHRLHHVGEDRAEGELALYQQMCLAGRFVGLFDLLRQRGKTEALGAIATTMREFAELYPDFLLDPETEEQYRLVSLYTSAMNGETSESI